MNRPADIVYVLPRPEIGGAERQLLMLLERLDRRVLRPHLICLEGEGRLLPEFTRLCDSVDIIGRRTTIDLAALAQIVRILQELRPAIVHTWLHIANVYGGWGARLAGVPVVIASHRGLAKDPSHGYLAECVKRALNFAVAQFSDRLIANAEAVARRMWDQGFAPHRTVVVYNGLIDWQPSAEDRENARTSLRLVGDEVLVGTIARIDPKKDLETMLRAVALVARNIPTVRLLVLGGGYPGYLKRLKKLAGSLAIDDRVQFLDFRDDAHAVMSLCKISLLSSVTEGLPNAVLESMMLRKPIVSTCVGGVPELITDGCEGFLVRPGDHQMFADRISQLIQDSRLAGKMGEAGRRKVTSEFAPETMAGRTQAVYAEFL